MWTLSGKQYWQVQRLCTQGRKNRMEENTQSHPISDWVIHVIALLHICKIIKATQKKKRWNTNQKMSYKKALYLLSTSKCCVRHSMATAMSRRKLWQWLVIHIFWIQFVKKSCNLRKFHLLLWIKCCLGVLGLSLILIKVLLLHRIKYIVKERQLMHHWILRHLHEYYQLKYVYILLSK